MKWDTYRSYPCLCCISLFVLYTCILTLLDMALVILFENHPQVATVGKYTVLIEYMSELALTLRRTEVGLHAYIRICSQPINVNYPVRAKRAQGVE